MAFQRYKIGAKKFSTGGFCKLSTFKTCHDDK